jgi:LysR family pca operon transcriptional activator
MKPRSPIGLRHLRAFVEIACQDNLMKASKALNLAHSAVYRTLQELEHEFDVPLIERGHKSVVLTTAGKVLRDRAAEVLASFADAMRAVQNTKMRQEVLRVGTSPTCAGLLLPAAVARMLRETGLVRVQIISGEFKTLVTALRTGELDMIVGRLNHHDMADLSFDKLYEEEVLAVCRPGHPLTDKPQLSLDRLGQFPLIVPPRDHPLRACVDDYFLAEGADLPSFIESTSDVFSRSYVVKYDAIWFVPPGAIELDLESGLLATLAVHSNLFRRPVGVTTYARHRGQQSARLFARILAEMSAEFDLARGANQRAATIVDASTVAGRTEAVPRAEPREPEKVLA